MKIGELKKKKIYFSYKEKKYWVQLDDDIKVSNRRFDNFDE